MIKFPTNIGMTGLAIKENRIVFFN